MDIDASGEVNLGTLLRSMQPELLDGEFVFVTLPRETAHVLARVSPVMTFREREGLTLILRDDAAQAAGLDGVFPCRLITLNVHSALNAVGFLAAISAKLAGAGISVNTVSAFYHDHLFVPVDRADEALRLLRELATPPPLR
jgi:hypothetical protein